VRWLVAAAALLSACATPLPDSIVIYVTRSGTFSQMQTYGLRRDPAGYFDGRRIVPTAHVRDLVRLALEKPRV
jgi:hypothetical protein